MQYKEERELAASIEIMNDWLVMVRDEPERALAEQTRIRREFEAAFAEGLVCRSFRRDASCPEYLLYRD